MKKHLKIVITGGGTGIGSALAKALGKEKHIIFICGRRVSKLREVANTSGNIHFCSCDVSNEEEVINFLEFVKKKTEYIDVLINCAGIFGPVGRFDKTESVEWKKTFEINTFGTYLMTKHFLDMLLKSKTKKIINFSGGGGFNPFPNYSSYAVSKAAVVRFSENLATELEKNGVKVNCIAPGFVATGFHKATLDAGREKAGNQYDLTIKKLKEGSVPIVTPVNCIKFLISDESNGITGKTISASFDRWDTNVFKKNINEINSSDLYTQRRINLVNLDEKNELRKKLTKVQEGR